MAAATDAAPNRITTIVGTVPSTSQPANRPSKSDSRTHIVHLPSLTGCEQDGIGVANAETRYPLTTVAAGQELYLQFLFVNPPSCTGSATTSASYALKVTVQ